MDYAHVLHAVKDLAHRGEILSVDAHRNGLEACDRFNDLGKDLLSGLGTAAPHVGAMRPENPGALLLLVLAGHIETVFFGR